MTEKSVLGVDSLYYATIDDSPDAYTPGTPVALAPLANISFKPKANSKTEYYDNKASGSLFAEGESEGEMSIQGLALDMKAALLGRVWDAVNKRMYDGGETPPYVALGYRALKSDNTYRYYWYLKCQFAPPDDEAETKTDTPNPKPTKLKVKSLFTEYEFDVDGVNNKPQKKVEADTSITGVDVSTWFDAVQIPSPGTPAALTCTPSPADDAIDVAVSVSPTLTFSNPLAGGAENGIVLVELDGYTVVAGTRTLNAARTVVTLNPTSNLSPSVVHEITVLGVTDVYGQALDDAVYQFTTAA